MVEECVVHVTGCGHVVRTSHVASNSLLPCLDTVGRMLGVIGRPQKSHPWLEEPMAATSTHSPLLFKNRRRSVGCLSPGQANYRPL